VAKRQRSTVEAVGQVVLGLEAFVAFFATLLSASLWPQPIYAWIGGPVLIVLLLWVGSQLRHRWAVVAGWILQVLLVALGVVVPTMYVVGALCLALWAYAVVRATRIDRERAAQFAQNNTVEGTV